MPEANPPRAEKVLNTKAIVIRFSIFSTSSYLVEKILKQNFK